MGGWLLIVFEPMHAGIVVAIAEPTDFSTLPLRHSVATLPEREHVATLPLRHAVATLPRRP